MYFRKVAGALLSRVEDIMCKQGCVSQEQLWRGLSNTWSNTKHFGGECAGIAFDGMMVSSVADKSHE